MQRGHGAYPRSVYLAQIFYLQKCQIKLLSSMMSIIHVNQVCHVFKIFLITIIEVSAYIPVTLK